MTTQGVERTAPWIELPEREQHPAELPPPWADLRPGCWPLWLLGRGRGYVLPQRRGGMGARAGSQERAESLHQEPHPRQREAGALGVVG